MGAALLAVTGFYGALAQSPAKGPDPHVTGREGKCGSVDLVIAIDTTHSMARAIREMKREAVRLLDLISFVSAGDFRLGLVSFKDTITVEQDLGSMGSPDEERRQMSWVIRRLQAEGGRGGPEASDEALRTAILSLDASGRQQIGDFQGVWEARSRILVLITDNLPGGFDDKFVQGQDDLRALAVTQEALRRNITISSVYVPTAAYSITPDARVAEIMRAYPQLTGGVFAATAEAGAGAAEAIANIIERCGSSPLS